MLHYNQNDQPCQAGELLLLDVAAGLGNYMSDLTRTIPVSGRFTRRQKQVYNAVLRVFRQMVRAMVPGKTTKDLRTECEQLIAEECVGLGLLKAAALKKQTPDNPAAKPFFMHGVAHPIGLDVHDVGDYRIDGESRLLEPGMVLTIEPGLYVAAGDKAVHAKWRGIGIRTEDDVLVTGDGHRVLTGGLARSADEIEAFMAAR